MVFCLDDGMIFLGSCNLLQEMSFKKPQASIQETFIPNEEEKTKVFLSNICLVLDWICVLMIDSFKTDQRDEEADRPCYKQVSMSMFRCITTKIP